MFAAAFTSRTVYSVSLLFVSIRLYASACRHNIFPSQHTDSSRAYYERVNKCGRKSSKHTKAEAQHKNNINTMNNMSPVVLPITKLSNDCIDLRRVPLQVRHELFSLSSLKEYD